MRIVHERDVSLPPDGPDRSRDWLARLWRDVSRWSGPEIDDAAAAAAGRNERATAALRQGG